MNFVYRAVRKEKGLTLEKAAGQIGRTKQWLSEVERGNIKLDYDEAVKLAAVYEGTPDIFLPRKSGEVGLVNNQSSTRAQVRGRDEKAMLQSCCPTLSRSAADETCATLDNVG
jgi:transcriptional regulator with XRE-family HTH domain